jgi:hypothetical protein
MSLSRLGKGLLLALALFSGPSLAFAQVSAIQGGVDTAARAAGVTTTSCRGTACVLNIISRLITIAINFSGILLLCYLLYAGFLWMTASGDPKQVTAAQDMIKNAVAGLVLITVSFAISSFVLEQLGVIITGQQPSTPAGAEVQTSGPGAGAAAGAAGAAAAGAATR